jgi:hypothetical protein
VLQVADLDRGERLARDARVGEGRQHRLERPLGLREEAHIVPECVVGIEADEVDGHGE